MNTGTAAVADPMTDPQTIASKLTADLARFDWDFTCEACGAGLFHDDDFVSDPEGMVSGCWASMTDLPSARERPCYAYRVGKPPAVQTPSVRTHLEKEQKT